MTHLEFTCSDEKATALLKAARLFDEGVKPAEWINVKDRLPMGMTSVLMFIDGRGVMIGYYQPIDGLWSYDGWSPGTHWMPLPEPPKDASDASDH
jgi:hypothetical protein